MTSSPQSPQSPHYTVSVWESIAITAGAVLLVAIGLAGLGVKALNNAFDPRRAQATAQSIASYEIPGGAKGVFGTNLGGGKVAVMNSLSTVALPPGALPPAATVPPSSSDSSSNSSESTDISTADTLPAGTAAPPQTELFLARIPITEGANNPSSDEDVTVDSSVFFSGFSFSYQDVDAFQINSARNENRPLCGANVPVMIQTGILIVTPGAPPIPAVRYQAETKFKEHTFAAIVSALGDTAENHAALVFDSLRCR